MPAIYSTHEAKNRFSEILRKVRSGQTVRVSYHGKPIAEIGPIRERHSLEDRVEQLAAEGIVVGTSEPTPARLRPVARREGALARFLESRDE